MCSPTVRQGSSRSSWNKNAVRAGSTPSTTPDSGTASPARIRSKVVLPQPDGPLRAVRPRSGISRENPSSTTFPL